MKAYGEGKGRGRGEREGGENMPKLKLEEPRPILIL